MSQPDTAAGEAPPPPAGLSEPVLARQNRLRLSLVWIVPIAAVIIGAVLVVRSLVQAGPEITIAFGSAEGIEPRRTEVRFKDVVVGHVKQVLIQPDRQGVRVVVGLDKSVENIAVEDTRFWVVRPRIGSGGVSGLNTLLSGVYIGVDAGASQEPRREFDGLDTPPLVLRGEAGRSFVLEAEDLGSLDVGSPIYFRRVQVGRVVGFALEPGGTKVEVQIFVEAAYEPLVTSRSLFWNASGVDLALGAGGLTVNTQSLTAVLAGGVAFANPPSAASAPQAASGQHFPLFTTQHAASVADDGDPLRVRMVFDQSLRGLDVGAPIDLRGIDIGAVRRIEIQPGTRSAALPMEVVADIYPRRLGKLRPRAAATGDGAAHADRELLRHLVQRGLRAQVRTDNLLTGQLYIALDFMPGAGRADFDASAAIPTLPSVPGTLDDLQQQLASIVGRLSKVRFDEIGSDLQGTLKSLGATGTSLQSTLHDADVLIRQLTPQAQRTLADVQHTLAAAQRVLRDADQNVIDPAAPLQRNAGQTLAELQRAARALRVLVDYLQQHPESLLRGKPPDAQTGPTTDTPR